MKRIVTFIFVSAVFGISSIRADVLSGSVVGNNGQPVSGCAVCLLKAALVDTTVGGNFQFADVPVTAYVPGNSGISRMQSRNLYVYVAKQGIVSLSIFDLRGKMVARPLDNQTIQRGTYRFDPLSYVPNAPARGAYAVRVTVNGRTSVHPLMAVGAMPKRVSLHKNTPQAVYAQASTEDTLIVTCPGYAEKKIPVASYSAALGKIAVAPAPAAAFTEVVFAVRNANQDVDLGHWYANIGYYSLDPSRTLYGSQGRLCKLNLATKQLTLLVNDVAGSVRDPQVSYDGTKILFSYRKGGSGYYNLYEIGTNGAGLRQITSGPYDDIEPIYLPDGGIAFCSSRCKRWVNCNVEQVAVVYRCEIDGTKIRQLSANIEMDNTPWMLPDGRLMYQRWEYVDRSQMKYHHLWYMNPDGTNQMVYFGNYNPNDLYIDAKPIPGTSKVVMVNSAAHGKFEHAGNIAILSVDKGPDDLSQLKNISSIDNLRDPYPVTADSFLVAQDAKLLLMKSDGTTTDIYTLPSTLTGKGEYLNEPRPIHARPKEPVLASTVNTADSMGTLLLMDVTIGRNMAGVKKGEIKKLLILETLPKPINVWGEMEPITFGGTFTLNRVVGTIPVEEDGSAYMELPANRSFFFVALDNNDNSVKRMQSFLSVVPGERGSCIGCHEERTMVTPTLPPRIAASKPPVRPQPIAGMPQVFNYPRDIQPVWDKYCLSCHNADSLKGGVNMTGDNGPIYTLSYFGLVSRLQMADGRNMQRSEYPPRCIGSTASPLMNKINGSHHNVVLTAQELRKIKLWIDASAIFSGTYASLGSGAGLGVHRHDNLLQPDIFWPSYQTAKQALDRRCASCHTGAMKLPTAPSDHMAIVYDMLSYNPGSTYSGSGYGYDCGFLPPWLVESGNEPDLRTVAYSFWKVVDGVISSNDWASNGESNPWVQLSWSSAQAINKIVLYDRFNSDDWSKEGLLTFSDGSQVTVTGIPNDGSACTVTFATKTVSWVKFQVQNGQQKNGGLSEFQVFNTSNVNVALSVSNVTGSSIYGTSLASKSEYVTNVGSTAWMKKFAAPQLQFDHNRVFNLTHPEKSLMLKAPLARSAGGHGTCGTVFTSTSDPDYQAILTFLTDGKNYLDTAGRLSQQNFKPFSGWVREMIRYGILPAGTVASTSIDLFGTDEKYWKSLWWKPEGTGVTSVIRR